jgi:hypothetical protein
MFSLFIASVSQLSRECHRSGTETLGFLIVTRADGAPATLSVPVTA